MAAVANMAMACVTEAFTWAEESCENCLNLMATPDILVEQDNISTVSE